MQKICIWTPDKDLAQCVEGNRVVQVDRRGKAILGAVGVRAKYGVEPALIPDYLALVGDAADGYPGIAGIGAVGAARLLNRHGPIEAFAASVLGERVEQALLFKRLATLRDRGVRGVDGAGQSAAAARTLPRRSSGDNLSERPRASPSRAIRSILRRGVAAAPAGFCRCCRG